MAKHNHSHGHGGKQHSHGHSHHGNGSGGNSNHHPNGQHGGGGGGGNQGGNQDGGNNGGGGQNQNDQKGYQLPDFLNTFLNRSSQDVNKMAASQVDQALHPYLAQIDLAQTQAKQQYGTDVTKAGNIYQGLQNDLKPLGNQYSAAAKDVSGNLQDSLGALAKDIPTGGFGQENKAYSDAYGAAGASALGMLSSDAARQAGYQASATRQAGIEQSDVQANYLGDLQNALDQLSQRRQDVMAQAPEMTTNRLNDLMQNQLEGNLSVEQFLQNAKAAASSRQSDRALQQYLMKQIGQTDTTKKPQPNNPNNKKQPPNGKHPNQGSPGTGNHHGHNNNGAGGGQGPFGPGAKDLQNALRRFAYGREPWKKLGGQEKKYVTKHVSGGPWAADYGDDLQRMFGGGPYSPQQYIDVIKKLYHGRSGGGGGGGGGIGGGGFVGGVGGGGGGGTGGGAF